MSSVGRQADVHVAGYTAAGRMGKEQAVFRAVVILNPGVDIVKPHMTVGGSILPGRSGEPGIEGLQGFIGHARSAIGDVDAQAGLVSGDAQADVQGLPGAADTMLEAVFYNGLEDAHGAANVGNVVILAYVVGHQVLIAVLIDADIVLDMLQFRGKAALL